MKYLVAIAAVLILSGCAVPRVQVDLQDPTNPTSYQDDLHECQGLALHGVSLTEEQQREIAISGGAQLASVMAFGSPTPTADLGVGIVAGIVNASRAVEEKQQTLIARCLWYRGYTVIGPWGDMNTPIGRCVHACVFCPDERRACLAAERQREIEWAEKWGKPTPVFDD